MLQLKTETQLPQTIVSRSTVSLDETQTAIMQGKICPIAKAKLNM